MLLSRRQVLLHFQAVTRMCGARIRIYLWRKVINNYSMMVFSWHQRYTREITLVLQKLIVNMVLVMVMVKVELIWYYRWSTQQRRMLHIIVVKLLVRYSQWIWWKKNNKKFKIV